ncbi:MAG: hypothetical protein UY22_C0016G0019 [Candidatus Amesbacteria bacterium GW2011_GWC1_48_10]|uniref:Uncharacterized protein n=1 Tax=Candidatus Amesbacteria bacterium GW2011_GWC1_48_10 TaxID=1618365 RepID=A0A0G1UI80_9BACT|nr:MAG: hypothetical protein UY22_C0016G0019 [Candidatus Amesbacteria bacterium GW2011_GWC1_48_10]
MVRVEIFRSETVKLCGYVPAFIKVRVTGWPALTVIAAGSNLNSSPRIVISLAETAGDWAKGTEVGEEVWGE